jgi:hypothetical protein
MPSSPCQLSGGCTGASTGMWGRGENKKSREDERRGWQGVEKDLGEAEQEELGVAKARRSVARTVRKAE